MIQSEIDRTPARRAAGGGGSAVVPVGDAAECAEMEDQHVRGGQGHEQELELELRVVPVHVRLRNEHYRAGDHRASEGDPGVGQHFLGEFGDGAVARGQAQEPGPS